MTLERFLKKDITIAVGIAVIYLLWVNLAVGFRNDHLFFVVLCMGMYFGHGVTRKVFLALFFFIVYWVVYDSLRIYPNYEFNPVNVREPYEIEKGLFGFQYQGETVTPNEFFVMHTHPVLDVLSGFFYLSWVPVPLMFAVWLFFRDKRMLLDFSLAFLLTNLYGFVLYYAYPAAPPWYVELHGFQENFSIPGNEAGLANFDRIMGIELFHSMYAKNANVFAAIPSLHAAYPVITLYFAIKKKLGLAVWAFFVICVGIWFAAIYTRHHYIIDVLLGILCALATILVFEQVILKTKVNGWLDRYAALLR